MSDYFGYIDDSTLKLSLLIWFIGLDILKCLNKLVTLSLNVTCYPINSPAQHNGISWKKG